MKLFAVFKPESSQVSWIFPALILGVYAVLDWNVASAGGNSLLGLIIPFQQALVLLYWVGLVALVAIGFHLVINRRLASFAFYLIFIVFFTFQVRRDRDSLLVVSQERSWYALQTMLRAPENFDVWSSTPELKSKFLDEAKKGQMRIKFDRALPFFHTYIYQANVLEEKVEIEVLMLRHKTRFYVSQQFGAQPAQR